jgi:hypothetical protein
MASHCPVACRDIDRSDQRKQCTDVHPKCSDWAKAGECTDGAVKRVCAKSCDHCVGGKRKFVEKETPPDSCVDIDDLDLCKLWAGAGECKNNPTVS